MKVLIVHGRYRSVAPSGENRVVDVESEALSQAGHDVVHYSANSDDIEGWPLSRRATLPVRSVRNGVVRRDLEQGLRRERPDVVHVHNTFPLLSPSVLLACRDQRVPVVATVHNYKMLCASGDFFRNGRPCHECALVRPWPGLRYGCYRGSHLATLPVFAGLMVNRELWRSLVAAYIFISHSQRDLHAGLELDARRVFVKYNLVPPMPQRAEGERQHQVAYVGRLDEAKGISVLMSAWERYVGAWPNSGLRLAVAGGGPMEERVRVWAAGLSSVDVLGMLTREEVARTLSQSRAAVAPSAWEETFGLVAIEAMAAGAVPVLPAHGSFPELVQDGVDGVLFAPGDAEALAAVFHEIDRQPERFASMSEQAKSSYVDQFDPKANLQRLLDIYSYAIDHPLPASENSWV